MKNFLVILIIIALIIMPIAGWFILGLNKIVTLHEKTKEAWSQVENQLQRRNDLIPNLVNTVKGYMVHERSILEEVTRFRSQWANVSSIEEKIKVAEGISQALSRLLLVVENYPDLKASQNFLTLQAQLEGTENRIAVERNRYNRAVNEFNTYIRTVFGSFFARLKGLEKPTEYFQAEAAAKAVPKVEF